MFKNLFRQKPKLEAPLDLDVSQPLPLDRNNEEGIRNAVLGAGSLSDLFKLVSVLAEQERETIARNGEIDPIFINTFDALNDIAIRTTSEALDTNGRKARKPDVQKIRDYLTGDPNGTSRIFPSTNYKDVPTKYGIRFKVQELLSKLIAPYAEYA